MLRPIACTCACLLVGTLDTAWAQSPPVEPTTAAPTASASIANPAISVIGWFQAYAGNDPSLPAESFQLPEAELAFQAAVDPFSRADFFMSAGEEGFDLEEGYLTWLALPGGGQAKVGKFRADLGKFNRTHPPETPFADRPLAAEAFLGEEGLTTTGLSASVLIPNPKRPLLGPCRQRRSSARTPRRARCSAPRSAATCSGWGAPASSSRRARART